jgi:hypothetical protein
VESKFIKKFLDRDRWSPEHLKNPKWLMVTLDPNTKQGKGTAETAMAAVLNYDGKTVVSFIILIKKRYIIHCHHLALDLLLFLRELCVRDA